MKRSTGALAALILAAAACGRAQDEPKVAYTQAAPAQPPAAVVPAPTVKPVVHVYKSPT